MQQVASHVGAHQKVPSGGTKEGKGNRSCCSPPAALPHKLGYLITTQHELHWELPALRIDQDLCAPLQHLCTTEPCGSALLQIYCDTHRITPLFSF